jgi:hypothetical protein
VKAKAKAPGVPGLFNHVACQARVLGGPADFLLQATDVSALRAQDIAHHHEQDVQGERLHQLPHHWGVQPDGQSAVADQDEGKVGGRMPGRSDD